MEPITLDPPRRSPVNKNEYTAPNITTEDFLCEYQQLLEGEARPLVNIEEKDYAFVIEVAAPGLRNSDFNVSMKDNILTITCLHKKNGCEKKLFLQHEFDFHCFTKDIALPKNIDTGFISAEYAGGMLRIIVPKSIKPFMERTDWIVVY